MKQVILHLGSNVGDRVSNIQRGISHLNSNVGEVLVQSSLYETEPWGLKEQSNFLNLALRINTNLAPDKLLDEVKNIEQEVGRTKEEHWGPRVLDIDILFYEDFVLKGENLTIPHQELQNRNFVLIPLMEIAGEMMHPLLNKTIEELYIESQDRCDVWIFEN